MSRRASRPIPTAERIRGLSLLELHERRRDDSWREVYLSEIERRAEQENIDMLLTEAIRSGQPQILEDLLDVYQRLGVSVNTTELVRASLQNRRYAILGYLASTVSPYIFVRAYELNRRMGGDQTALGILMLTNNDIFYQIGGYLVGLFADPATLGTALELSEIIFGDLPITDPSSALNLLEDLASIGVLVDPILDSFGRALFQRFEQPNSQCDFWQTIRRLLVDERGREYFIRLAGIVPNLHSLSVREIDRPLLERFLASNPPTSTTVEEFRRFLQPEEEEGEEEEMAERRISPLSTPPASPRSARSIEEDYSDDEGQEYE